MKLLILKLAIVYICLTSTYVISNEIKSKSKSQSKFVKAFLSKSLSESEKTKTAKKSTTGQNANFPGQWNIPDATTYGYASTDAFVLQNQAGFIEPVYMDRLPAHLNSEWTGVYEAADTGIHNRNYYDGSYHLGVQQKVHCSLYTVMPRSCVSKPGCGWCGEKNKCIEASPLGPIAPCMRSTFLWKMPSPEWNPLKAPTINIHAVDTEGKSMIKITHEPDFSRADVNKPYKLG